MGELKRIIEEVLPPELRAVYETGDEARILEAFDALPEEKKQEIIVRIRQKAGEKHLLVPGAATATDIDLALKEFDSFLRAIAAVARGKGGQGSKNRINRDLARLEQHNWRLTEAAHRIWDGERDAEALTAGLDSNSARLVERVLELLEESSADPEA